MKSLSLVCGLLACLLSATAVAAEVLPVAPFKNLAAGKKQTVIVYGTSLTAGGAWAPAMKSWFEEKYPGLVTFINSGGGGKNSGWGKEQLQAKVLKHQPDLVFIEFSYNDAHSGSKLTVENGAENLDFIVTSIRRERPECAIVLQTMNVPWDATEKRSAGNRPQLEAYNDNYRQYAKKAGLPLVDHYQSWKAILDTDPDKYFRWLPDGSHPTKEASLAVTWVGLKDLLERTRTAAATP